MDGCRSFRVVLFALSILACVAAPAAADDAVEIHVERFGACNAYRPGDMVGMRVRLRSGLTEPVSVMVQWEVENADGDVASFWRDATLPPGQHVTRWLYARLPPATAAATSSRIFTLRVYEADDHRRLRPLGALRFTPEQAEDVSLAIEQNQDVIAVVGDGRLGLQELAAMPPGFAFVPSMNSLTPTARGVTATEFPDRWEGLWSFQQIVWSRETPQQLTGERAAALREWIDRGGSLIIVLPAAGNPWSIGGGAANFLSDLLPTRGVVPVDGVLVESLLPALSRATSLRRDGARTAVTIFDPQQLTAPWSPLIPLPDVAALPGSPPELLKWNGRGALAVRRSVGHGSVTLVGVDIDALHRASLASESLPQVDVFWNRILGRRADAMSASDFQRLAEMPKRRLALANQYDDYDCGSGELVSGSIGLQGRAAGGVLATLALFGAYWLLACPLAWFALKRKKMERWSWMAFVAVALLASAAASMLSGLLGAASTELRHLTVLDAVAGADASQPRAALATTWFSAMLPGFGQTEVSVGPADARTNIVTSWSPPPSGNGQRFPDTARFDQPIDEPNHMRLPSRATTSDFEVRWLGAVPAAWGALPEPVAGKPLVAVASNSGAPRVSLSGTLTHRLPAALKNVMLIHVSPFRHPTPQWTSDARLTLQPSAPLPNAGRMVALADEWAPGQEIDLAKALYPAGAVDPAKVQPNALSKELRDRYTMPLLQVAQRNFAARGVDPFGAARPTKCLEMLSLFQILDPPAYQMNPPDAPTPLRITRELGRHLDLSLWLTRPCLIILGTLEGVATPVPVSLSGSTPQSRGDVLVRCVFPLPDEWPLAFQPLPVP